MRVGAAASWSSDWTLDASVLRVVAPFASPFKEALLKSEASWSTAAF